MKEVLEEAVKEMITVDHGEGFWSQMGPEVGVVPIGYVAEDSGMDVVEDLGIPPLEEGVVGDLWILHLGQEGDVEMVVAEDLGKLPGVL